MADLRVRAQAVPHKHAFSRDVAILVRDELLIKWLLVLPWRQRNIRECRILGDNPNLFKAAIPPWVHIATPPWVDDQLRANPSSTFWQFYFRDEETKIGRSVRGVIPRALIAILEEYLESYRPQLIQGPDPGTVLLNQRGHRLGPGQMVSLVSDLTLRYAKRRVTPHLFRDIFAYEWLEDHPADYLTLSKILWHTNINTTLRIYGRNFDESNGAASVDRWLEERIGTKT